MKEARLLVGDAGSGLVVEGSDGFDDETVKPMTTRRMNKGMPMAG